MLCEYSCMVLLFVVVAVLKISMNAIVPMLIFHAFSVPAHLCWV